MTPTTGMGRGPVVNRKRIDAGEYDEIRTRLRALGRSDEALATIAAEFRRGIKTINRLAGRMGI